MRESELRRQAVQIAAMLPEKRGDALKVIALLTQLATSFVWPDAETPIPENVVEFIRPSDGAA